MTVAKLFRGFSTSLYLVVESVNYRLGEALFRLCALDRTPPCLVTKNGVHFFHHPLSIVFLIGVKSAPHLQTRLASRVMA